MRYRYWLILSLFVVGLCVAFFSVVNNEAKQEAIKSLNDQQIIIARQAKQSIEKLFDRYIRVLSNNAQNERIITLDREGKRVIHVLYDTFSDEVAAVSRVNESGRIVYTYPVDPASIGQDVSDQDHIKEIRRTQKPVVSDVFTAVQGFRAIAVHVPVFQGKDYRGSLAFLVRFERIAQQNLEGIRMGEDGYAWMISREGIELYCPVPGHVGKSVFENCKDFPDILAMAKNMVAGKQGVAAYEYNLIRDKTSRVMKHAVYLPVRIGNTFWSIVVATPDKEALNMMERFRTKLIAIFGILLLVGISLSYVGGRAWVILSEEKKRKEAERALSESEETILKERERFLTLIEKAPFGMMLIGKEGRITYMNPQFKALFGYALTDIPDGRTWFRKAYPDPEYRHLLISEWLRDFREGEVDRTVMKVLTATCKDGSEKEISSASLRLSSGEVLFCCEDITQLKESQEALRESEAKYRTVVDNSLVGFCIIQDDTFKFVNKRFCEIYGYSYDEFVANKMDIMHPIHPDYRERVRETVRKRLAGEVAHLEHEFKAVRKDGKTINVKVFGSSIIYNGRPATTGSVIDVTREKMLESQFLQAQKMEAIGVLAGGIAHDFNNILMTILGYISVLLTETAAVDPRHEKLKIMEQQVQHGANLTKQLLGFARGGKYETKPTDLNGLLARSADMFGRTKREITIYSKFEEDLRTVEVDRGQMEQVFLNLFVNAWQAMPGGGELYLETANVPSRGDVPAYVKVSVTDTGVGMDEATRQRIFEPFFTTKGMGRGTGLGLTSVYSIVKNHGGSIEVFSEKGKGTTFDIYLPASDKAVTEEQKTMGDMHTGSETILLIDDQDAIVNVGKVILEKLGYTVLTAYSGEEAVAVYEKEGEKIDLVILDMIMPGMSGGKTYKMLKEMNPGIKAILSSGYSLNEEAAEIMENGCNGFIQKPFNAAELSKKIREVLA